MLSMVIQQQQGKKPDETHVHAEQLSSNFKTTLGSPLLYMESATCRTFRIRVSPFLASGHARGDLITTATVSVNRSPCYFSIEEGLQSDMPWFDAFPVFQH